MKKEQFYWTTDIDSGCQGPFPTLSVAEANCMAHYLPDDGEEVMFLKAVVTKRARSTTTLEEIKE